eukprot:2023281-Pyramimonas_sp.AAC.1
MERDAERAAGYEETQWAKDLRQWGIDDRERKQKQEEERIESINKQKQASKDAVSHPLSPSCRPSHPPGGPHTHMHTRMPAHECPHTNART